MEEPSWQNKHCFKIQKILVVSYLIDKYREEGKNVTPTCIINKMLTFFSKDQRLLLEETEDEG